jgi:hypothetical protein
MCYAAPAETIAVIVKLKRVPNSITKQSKKNITPSQGGIAGELN